MESVGEIEGSRGMGRMRCSGLAVLLVVMATAEAGPMQNPQDRAQSGPANPTLTQRPLPKPQSLLIPEGKIKLDVVVNDAAGNPVTGLQPWDFTILDDGRPRKVMSFRSYDGVQVRPDPPVEVILVMDMMNLPFQQVSFVRKELESFLRQNGGQLKQPVTLVVLNDKGIRVQPRPSTDGNAIAELVSGVEGSVRILSPVMGGDGYVERFQRSARAIDNIAQNELKKPGRKLLIWAGPGWPMLNRPSDGYTPTQQKRNFDGIVELTTALREARITVYSVAPGGEAGGNEMLYQKYLKGVRDYHDAESGNLGLKVLVTQTGGKIEGPSNDMVSALNACIENAGAFYRISFDPPAAEHADEYHDLKVTVNKPGVTVRTTTGYYNQPAGH
jgi:VWFA-related protein